MPSTGQLQSTSQGAGTCSTRGGGMNWGRYLEDEGDVGALSEIVFQPDGKYAVKFDR